MFMGTMGRLGAGTFFSSYARESVAVFCDLPDFLLLLAAHDDE